MIVWTSLLVGSLIAYCVFAYMKGTEYIMEHHRWIFVCFGLLPISLVYGAVLDLRTRIVYKMNSAPDQHARKVEQVCEQIRAWKASGSKQKLCTGRAGWESTSLREGRYKTSDDFRKINIPLYDVLKIDTSERFVRAEAMVRVVELVALVNAEGWTIPVVPELEDLTVGGTCNGSAVEMSSHKHGLWQHNCVAYEVVLPSGEVKRCSKDENPELFYSIPWSCGTIGFVTSADIRIIPARKYVRLEYRAAKIRDEVIRIFNEQTRRTEDNDFIEGLMFSQNEGVIMTGSMTDHPDIGKVNNIGNFYKPWFYKHVEGILEAGEFHVEYIPLQQYYFRHVRSILWEMEDILPFGNNPVFRYLFGWMVPPKISLMKRTQTEGLRKLYREKHIDQDIYIPINKMAEMLEFLEREVKTYPLWLCPFVLRKDPGMCHPPPGSDGLYIDIGAFGTPKSPKWSYLETTRAIEQYQRDNNGYQMLYADTYQSREQFRAMYDHSLYDKVRKDLGCEVAFPEVYDKISQEARF